MRRSVDPARLASIDRWAAAVVSAKVILGFRSGFGLSVQLGLRPLDGHNGSGGYLTHAFSVSPPSRLEIRFLQVAWYGRPAGGADRILRPSLLVATTDWTRQFSAFFLSHCSPCRRRRGLRFAFGMLNNQGKGSKCWVFARAIKVIRLTAGSCSVVCIAFTVLSPVNLSPLRLAAWIRWRRRGARQGARLPAPLRPRG